MNKNISEILIQDTGFLATLGLNELQTHPELPALEFGTSVSRLDAEIQMLNWNKYFSRELRGEGLYVPDLEFEASLGCRFKLIGDGKFLDSYLAMVATQDIYIVPGVVSAPEA